MEQQPRPWEQCEIWPKPKKLTIEEINTELTKILEGGDARPVKFLSKKENLKKTRGVIEKLEEKDIKKEQKS